MRGIFDNIYIYDIVKAVAGKYKFRSKLKSWKVCIFVTQNCHKHSACHEKNSVPLLLLSCW